MSEALRPARPNRLGVFGLMRIPGWARFNRTPRLARFFIALALLDIVVRLIGVMGPPIAEDFGPPQPLWPPTGLVPRTLWIALPGIILMRRPDAGPAIPWIFRGAVLLSLATIAAEPLMGLVVSGLLATSVLEPYPAAIATLAIRSVLLGVAWFMLARGFAALGPGPAAPAGRALATFVAATFALGAVVNVIELFAHSGGIANPELDPASFVLSVLETNLGSLATGAALWAVSRGLGDQLRPVRATRLGAAAAATWGLAALMGSLGTMWFLLNRPLPDFSEGLYALEVLVAWMVTAIAPAMLVAAIAIGLVDQDVPDHLGLSADQGEPARMLGRR